MAVRNVRPFVHLRVHSTYSLGVGLSSPAEVCAHARRAGFDAVALTDIHGTYGFFEFHRAASETGIKPIYGSHVLLDFADDTQVTLQLLALDRHGLRHLCEVTSAATEAREANLPFRVEAIDGYGGGLVALAGIWPQPDVLPMHAADWLSALAHVFDQRLFIEQRAAPEGIRGSALARRGRELKIESVLTQDIRYVGPEKHQLIDLVSRSNDRGYEHMIHSESIGNVDGRGHGMKSCVEMAEWYDVAPDAFDNSNVIASLVQPDLLAPVDRAIVTHTSDGDPLDALRARVDTALHARFGSHPHSGWTQRASEELDAIAEGGLAETFLRFHEVCDMLRGSGVAPGPANGLRLQSLCAFILGITTFNPYEDDPGFLPVFVEDGGRARTLDLQLRIEDRTRVPQVLGTLFDPKGIGYVPAVEHITPSRALRMAGDRMGVKREEYGELLKIASGHHGMSLGELVQDNRRFGQLARRSSAVRELISHAAAIEGLPYGFVRSKRTVLLSPRPLREFVAWTTHPDTGEHFVQSIRDAFPVGNIRRIDVTTLSALSVVTEVDDELGAEWRPVASPDAYRLIDRSDLEGIYLLESPLTGRQARLFGVASFSDLVQFVALMRYRRGDVSFPARVSAYRDKKGPHTGNPHSGNLTASTNGWLLFRCQLRSAVATLTGLDEREAKQLLDRFRTHDPADLAGLRQEFMQACAQNGVSMAEATSWFARTLRLSHRVVSRQRVLAEALLIDRMLHLKHRSRVPFFVAALNHTSDATRRESYLQAVERDGRSLAPDVNESGRMFTMENGNIRPPLRSVKGLSPRAATGILDSRPAGGYQDRDTFSSAVATAGVTPDEVEALVLAGALDSLGIEEAPDAGILQEPPEPESPPVASPSSDKGQLTLELPTAPDPPDDRPEAASAAGNQPVAARKDGNKQQ